MKVIREHPDMILREKHFGNIQINWNDKAQNMQKISEELNIGLNSFVFFDDDKTNQERIKSEFTEILTIDLDSDPSTYVKKLKDLNDFNILQRTDEDIKRGEMYSQQRQRNELKESVSNLNDFLQKLDIKVEIKNATDFNIPRISQLTLKTNQFNLTTRRYQEEEISAFALSKDRIVECAQVSDKFGDNGITGVYIVKKESNEEWIIDTFLLSCRIIGRGVEETMLSQIIEKAKSLGVKRIKGEFISTSKNKPAENFYNSYGFKKIGDYWIFDTNQKIETPDHIKLRRNDE
jgi:FkbH-like protein